MKHAFWIALVAVALAVPAGATSISGDLSIAGLDQFTNTGIHFTNPGFVLFASGSLIPMQTAGSPEVNLTSFNYASGVGVKLFDWNHAGDDVNMTITALTEVQDLGHFLNIAGTAELMETGMTPTEYDFTLTSTHPDGLTSYTLDLVPAMVPEPGTLCLLGTGLIAASLLLRGRKKLLGPLLVLLFTLPARAASITGDVAIAGINTYNSTVITFNNPGHILGATGSLEVMTGLTNININSFTFPGSPGFVLYTWANGGVDITFALLTGKILENTGQFLNIEGTGVMTETGFSDTDYAYTLTSTKAGVTSYALNLAPIPEPAPLIMILTGMLVVWFLARRKRHALMLRGINCQRG